MRIKLLMSAMCIAAISIGQTVTTFSGKENGDPTNNYEAKTSAVDKDSTWYAYPAGITRDPSGRFWIAERNKIRLVTGGNAYIRAGNPLGPTLSEGYKNATSTQATFRNPAGMVTNSSGVIFICDVENHCIRKLSAFMNVSNGQSVTTFAGANAPGTIPGNGVSGSADGTGHAARFNQPRGITIDGNGNFYVADYLNFTIRKITPGGVVTTLAGKAGVEGTTDNSNGANVRFGGPWGIAMLDANHLVVTDQWNTNVRKVNINTGATTTIAGPTTGANTQHVDGTLTAARFRAPKGVAVINGIIYVADQNTIRAIDVNGNSVTTFAGDKNSYDILDGTGTSAKFTELDGLYADDNGNMYACENSGLVASHVIRKITVNTLAPDVDFTATSRSLIIDEKTTLNDNSSGAAGTTFSWTITPSFFQVHTGGLSADNVEVSFDSTGFYTVKLEVTNQYGTDDEEKDAYINVSTTGAGITTFYNSELVKLYPNPARDLIYLEIDPSLNLSKTQLLVFNAQGKQVLSSQAAFALDVSNLNSGIYYMTLQSGNLNIAKRFVISR
ncbi:MAG: T9SS type A sorting domain-containing protein [Bacteroidia bacterium]